MLLNGFTFKHIVKYLMRSSDRRQYVIAKILLRERMNVIILNVIYEYQIKHIHQKEDICHKQTQINTCK